VPPVSNKPKRRFPNLCVATIHRAWSCRCRFGFHLHDSVVGVVYVVCPSPDLKNRVTDEILLSHDTRSIYTVSVFFQPSFSCALAPGLMAAPVGRGGSGGRKPQGASACSARSSEWQGSLSRVCSGDPTKFLPKSPDHARLIFFPSKSLKIL
jgi:hypothetical protein